MGTQVRLIQAQVQFCACFASGVGPCCLAGIHLLAKSGNVDGMRALLEAELEARAEEKGRPLQPSEAQSFTYVQGGGATGQSPCCTHHSCKGGGFSPHEEPPVTTRGSRALAEGAHVKVSRKSALTNPQVLAGAGAAIR